MVEGTSGARVPSMTLTEKSWTGKLVRMKKKRVSKSEFKPKAFEVLRRVEEERCSYVVTDRGKPVVELRPVTEQKHEALKLLRGQITRFDHPLEPADEA